MTDVQYTWHRQQCKLTHITPAAGGNKRRMATVEFLDGRQATVPQRSLRRLEPLRIYVAGKFEDVSRVKRIMAALARAGYVITFDWTVHDYISPDPTVADETRQHWAAEDIDGVRRCDVCVVVLIDNYPYHGALFEAGAAMGLGKPVVAFGAWELSSTLLHHPLVTRCLDWPEVLIVLSEIHSQPKEARREYRHKSHHQLPRPS